MKTTQTWGWLAAGVLAAGLNAAYHDGGLEWAHRVADRIEQVSDAVMALASGSADRFVAEVRRAGHDDAAISGVDAAIAQVQAKLADGQAGIARVEVMSARQEAQLARVQAVRARMEARIAARAARCRVAPAIAPAAFMRVVVPPACPRVRVSIPPAPSVNPVPAIHIEVSGSGPV